jgi:hypothetical protein
VKKIATVAVGQTIFENTEIAIKRLRLGNKYSGL